MKNRLLAIGLLFLIVTSQVFGAADTFRVIRSNILTKTSSPIHTNLVYDVVTLSANQTTPNASLGSVFVTAVNTGATAISGISNASAGMVFILIGGSTTTTNATTIADSGSFALNGAFTASANNTITLFATGASSFVELGRSGN